MALAINRMPAGGRPRSRGTALLGAGVIEGEKVGEGVVDGDVIDDIGGATGDVERVGPVIAKSVESASGVACRSTGCQPFLEALGTC